MDVRPGRSGQGNNRQHILRVLQWVVRPQKKTSRTRYNNNTGIETATSFRFTSGKRITKRHVSRGRVYLI